MASIVNAVSDGPDYDPLTDSIRVIHEIVEYGGAFSETSAFGCILSYGSTVSPNFKYETGGFFGGPYRALEWSAPSWYIDVSNDTSYASTPPEYVSELTPFNAFGWQFSGPALQFRYNNFGNSIWHGMLDHSDDCTIWSPRSDAIAAVTGSGDYLQPLSPSSFLYRIDASTAASPVSLSVIIKSTTIWRYEAVLVAAPTTPNPYLYSVESSPNFVASYSATGLSGLISTLGATFFDVESGQERPFEITDGSAIISQINGFGVYTHTVAPSATGLVGRTALPTFTQPVRSYIIVAYLDVGVGGVFDLLGMWDTGGTEAMMIRATNNSVYVSRNDAPTTPILEVANFNGPGWYAICVGFDSVSATGEPGSLYLTLLEAEVVWNDSEIDTQPSLDTFGTGVAQLEMFNESTNYGNSRIANVALFSSHLTSQQFEVHVNTLLAMV
jgi:hypothetical protein